MSEVQEQPQVMNRWLVVVGAVLIQLALGAIYAWSVFTPPLVELGWTRQQTQIVFSVGLASFAIVMVAAGQIILPKIGPRYLAMSGGVVLGLGYVLAGLVPVSVASLVILIGLMGGAGIGLSYVVPIGVGMAWFPDRKGMITGLAVAGFGFGATIWIKMADDWGNLLANFELQGTFIIYGIVFLVMVVGGGYFMVNPPKGWKPETLADVKVAEEVTEERITESEPEPEPEPEVPLEAEIDIGPMDMIKTKQYGLILFTFIFSAMSGLMTIGLAYLYPMEALVEFGGYTIVEAAIIAGTGMGIFYALANGIGRIVWGSISDKITVKKSIFLMCVMQGIAMIAFQWLAGFEWSLYIGITIIGFNFGGNFALFPAMTAETFGAKKVSANYGWVFLAYGIAGIIGPQLGGFLGDQGVFALAFTICGILTLSAAALAYITYPITKEQVID